MSKDLQKSLRALDESYLRRGMSPAMDRKLRARLFGGEVPRTSERRWSGLAMAGALCALLLAGFFGWKSLSGHRQIDGYGVDLASADLTTRLGAEGHLHIDRGSVTLVEKLQGMRIAVSRPSELAHAKDGIVVLHGTVEVKVARRAPHGEPARVHVSDGDIEVHGTRFLVQQDAAGGSVRLDEGAISFRTHDGRTFELTPGQSLTWPVPPPPAVVVPPPTPPEEEPPPAKVVPAPHRVVSLYTPETRATLDQVDALRTRGEYEEAVHTLQTALRTRRRVAEQEVLGYELGSILTYQVQDKPRACKYWGSFLEAHPHNRLLKEVVRAQASLDCRGLTR